MVSPSVFDETICTLGEGPLWHPLRQELFWFDIISHRLYNKGAGDPRQWQFKEPVSAAGWIDENSLLVASASSLSKFNIDTGNSDVITKLESDNPITRSNDGRADPYGGFWIGTMGRKLEPNVGAIYRYYKGELRKLYSDISISNAICFSPDGLYAYFVDTVVGKVMRQPLNEADGWPKGGAALYLDLSSESFGADGAVVDDDGNFWNAQWGGSRVACYNPAGKLIEEIKFSASQITCPAFGGENLSTMYITSAKEGLAEGIEPKAGQTFMIDMRVKGQAEHRVIL